MKATRDRSSAYWLLGAVGVAAACSLQVPSKDELFTNQPAGGAGGTGGQDAAGSGGVSASGAAGAAGATGESGAAGAGGAAGSSDPGSGGTAGAGGAAGAAGGSGQPVDPADHLVVHYRFDESSGSIANDALDSDNNAIIYGGASWIPIGRIGGALALSGSSETPQYVELPRNVMAGLEEVTIATWFRWEGGNEWARLFDFGSGTPTWIYFAPFAGGGARAAARSAQTETWFDVVLPVTPVVSAWTHVAISWDAATCDVYLDGALAKRYAEPPFSPTQLGTTLQNWIGRSQFAEDAYYAGAVDDFRIYSLALSAEQVAALHAGE